jgi:alkylation response protein AidB-like acyl-CoA dehydrogenase
MSFTAEERVMFVESANRFLADHYDDRHRRRLASSADGFGLEEWRAYAELGWLAALLPVEHSGLGGDAQDLTILMEAVGRGLLLEPLLASLVMGARLIELAGSASQQAAILPALASGDLMLAFAHMEPAAGHDRAWVHTVAEPAGAAGYRMSGEKTQVLHGNAAQQLIVSARVTDVSGTLGLFLIDRNASGVHIETLRAIDGRPMARVRLDGVTVSPAQRLGSGDAEPIVEAVLDRATLGACAEALGAMSACNAATLAYLKNRKQFGRSLANFQVLQHRMVDMTIAEVQARALIHAAAEGLDADAVERARWVSAAKIKTDESARFVCEQSIQLHGGMGMTDDLAIGHYYKRVLLLGSLFGDADWHLARLASMGNFERGAVVPQ